MAEKRTDIVSARLSSSLVKAALKLAEQQDISLSKFIETQVAKAVEAAGK